MMRRPTLFSGPWKNLLLMSISFWWRERRRGFFPPSYLAASRYLSPERLLGRLPTICSRALVRVRRKHKLSPGSHRGICATLLSWHLTKLCESAERHRWIGLDASSRGACLSLIHISEPTRLRRISYAVFC